MAAYFLDTSAMVKRYVAEQGHTWINSLVARSAAHTLLMAQIASVETIAALCRKARLPDSRSRLGASERDQAILLFRRDMQRIYSVIPITPDVLVRAGDLCLTHALRAYDAIQLACALTARDALVLRHVGLTLVSADKQLLAFASLEGFTVEDPGGYQ